MFSFKREASSETYGPRVYFPSYIFISIKPKTQKYLAAIYLPLLYSALLLIFHINLYQISSLQVTVKGLTTPLSHWVQVFDCLCMCIDWRLVRTSYWIDTLVLKTEGNTYLNFAASPFSLQGKNQRKLKK